MSEQKQTQQTAEERIVRVMSKDIEGKMSVYSGLATIKGVSWAIANAICKKLKIDRKKKIGELSEKDVKEIEDFMQSPNFPPYLVNRQKDIESGENKHLFGTDLELAKEFDIKRLRKIKSYRGLRHASNLPLRGQRTRANFRKNRTKGSGIKKKNKA